ncbi:MAG: DNA polymerase III subunit beta [Cyanobacteria bacterium]|nr:DNA polymerase III subunit beta [Cyanobacteriota bacterium]MDW8201895.1 DNA polymerase III subunit beta [Cyanobacteriota bacterium SKYGB_h_bin112]
MKFLCSQSEFNSHLSLVNRAVSSKPRLPILANVLVVADEQANQINLTGFDESLGIRTSFSAQVDDGGEITLPARLLSEIVSRLPAGDLVLEVSETEGSSLLATLTSLSGQYQVRAMGADEFPELPEVSDGTVTVLPVAGLIEGLQGTLFASSTEETKQILTGVHLSLRQDALEFAATDGHRLAVVETSRDEQVGVADDTGLEVTIPAKTLRELERMLAIAQTPTISVQVDVSQAVFEWGAQRLTSRLLDGQYPNYRQLIPRQFQRQVTLERRLFLAALERISVLADARNNVVKLSINATAQEVALSVDAQDVGMGREQLPAQISGDNLDIAFNVKYLMEGLRAIDATEVQLQLNTATSPVILTPLGAVKMTYLVMPVQIRS